MPRLCWGRMTAHGRVDPPERDGSLAAGRPLLGSCRCYWRAVRTLAGRAPGRLVRKGGDVQAASLQQTAASMEEISGTVAQTTDTAQLMAHESDQSGQGAGRSGAAIPEAGAAMEPICGSSRRMGEIIGVIESTAFQANLLALNAAVEAARAGG